MKAWWRRVRPSVAGGLVAWFAGLLGRTLRIQREGFEPIEALDGGKILCGWHGRSFLAATDWRMRGYWVMISHSRDGEIQNRVFQSLGFNIIRGSTGRGGERALVEAVKVLRKGATMAMTPDGPRGPSGVLQSGVMFMALKSGAALVPIGISARPRILAKSWDRYLVPLPFARAYLVAGEPIYLKPGSSPEEQEEVRRAFEVELHRIEAVAEARMGFPAIDPNPEPR